MSLVFRRAKRDDYPEVRRITRAAYVHAGHFEADHPYLDVLDDVEHRADHAEVWVVERSGGLVAAVTLTFAGQPYSESQSGMSWSSGCWRWILQFRATVSGERLCVRSSLMRGP